MIALTETVERSGIEPCFAHRGRNRWLLLSKRTSLLATVRCAHRLRYGLRFFDLIRIPVHWVYEMASAIGPNTRIATRIRTGKAI